ncbi:conserved domain-containing protein [Noviherbaspirillum humi]|uniref:Conserved domain-containing protein n=1 Tax=Noviherbaspirillum humi TaxID=1688639 RepID=A0A239BXC8_9BURK|nr:YsnF/AvaK domain-containing protein [Noviherbaspirillum humi]SNS12566.1 conserved domain-containing protein [Noviherbaspirillum humi]
MPHASSHHALSGKPVFDAAGHPATIVSFTEADAREQAMACIRPEHGPDVMMPLDLLEQRDDGSLRLPFSFGNGDEGRMAQVTFPVMQEKIQIDKRLVDTGRGIRLKKTVAEKEELVDEALLRDEISVERVAVNRVVDDAQLPQARYEGDTLIVPVLEEVLVLQKQTLLKEEVRITRRPQEYHAPQRIVLRREQIDIEPLGNAPSGRA